MAGWNTLVQADILSVALGRRDLAIVDCRFSLLDPNLGEQAWLRSHIPGAYYAHLERDLSDMALVGIRTRGVHLARRLARTLKEITGDDVPTGALDITMYRDDLMRHAVGPQPLVRRTEITFSIDNRKILLVDDVLYTGRTTRAALDALIDYGRPRAIQLIVLVDRGHRELPIKADYVGKNLPTAPEESVQVRLQESDGVDEVVLQQPLDAAQRTTEAV